MTQSDTTRPSSVLIRTSAGSVPTKDRYAQGKALRDVVPLTSHSIVPTNRPDPIAFLVSKSANRIASLLPIRYERMAVSPFTFLRGAAAIMARDLDDCPTTSIDVQACGDAHLLNFGMYNSPEQRVYFDINDFDETHNGPFEWDVKRLATSIVLAGRDVHLPEAAIARLVRGAIETYRSHIHYLASLSPYECWHSRVDVEQAIQKVENPKHRTKIAKVLDGSERTEPAWHDFPKLCHHDGGQWRIKENPPLIGHFDPTIDSDVSLKIEPLLAQYAGTLSPERLALFNRYRLVDNAVKVVGVGSVGLFCAILLMLDGDERPLFLQIKESRRSVLASRQGGPNTLYQNQGERVVIGQRLMQAAADIFLGFGSDKSYGRDFYIRQLKDRRLAAVGQSVQAEDLAFHTRLCALAMARAHGRTGDPAVLAGYLGKTDRFDCAIEAFSFAYADISKVDHHALLQAMKTGKVPGTPPNLT